MERLKHSEQLSADELFLQAILNVQRLGEEYEIDHRFVGGTITDLLNSQTAVSFDHKNRVMRLKNYNPPAMFRSSDGTIKDVDLICFCPDLQRFQEFTRQLKEQTNQARIVERPRPHISVEPTFYNPHWPERKRWRQFVTTFDVDKTGALSLNFGQIHQSISWESVAPWQVKLDRDGVYFTTLNPYAHALCYLLRVPSGIKRKDKEIFPDSARPTGRGSKVSLLMNLAHQADIDGKPRGYQYKDGHYQPWVEYIKKLLKQPDPLTAFKARFTRAYWDGPGEAIAHGRGAFRTLSTLSNRMSG